MTELWVCLKSVRAFLRAFLSKKFGGYLKILPLHCQRKKTKFAA